MEVKSFEELGLSKEITGRLEKIEIKNPTPVQNQAIPEIFTGKNIIFQSETGTGKTFAYLLPLVSKIESEEESKKAKIIVAAPTYELASQVKGQVQTVTERKSALFIGGSPLKRQIETLKEKPEIICGSPARILELIKLKKLKTDGIEAVVYDEVDRLLSPELRDETLELLDFVPKTAQVIACSATISEKTARIIQGAAKNGLETKILYLPPEDVLRKRITHIALFADRREKIDKLRSLLFAEQCEKALVFTSKVDQVQNIVSKLRYKKVDCAGMYSKQDKTERKATIDKFRSGKIKILVTSDLTSRGLDIPGITHVIQMDMPSNEDFFIHRAGRTARAGKTGINIVIGDEYEMRKYAALEKKLKITVYPKVLSNGKLISPADEDR